MKLLHDQMVCLARMADFKDLDIKTKDLVDLAEVHQDISDDKWKEMANDIRKKGKRKRMYRDEDGDT